MSNFVAKLLSKFVGSKIDKDRKELEPYIGKVNAEFQQLASISNDQLRQETKTLQAEIQQKLAPISSQIDALKEQVANPAINVAEQEKLYNEIDLLNKEHDKELEKVLLEVLPKAFAIVKETARRFKENDELEVTTTPFDVEIANLKANVEVRNDKTYWKNRWNAAGNEIKWEMMHYDVQIIGGVVLHQGKIAEMATGEGKTLVATFPAFLNAIGGKGVHIITVNDYLAKRDSEWMAPIFEFHGLRVDCIDKHQPNSEARRKAYQADITYGTNNEFGFDYLRDNMVQSPSQLVQRKHHYAMVDEVDSVLIDDARTPLIIAGPVGRTGQEEMFYQLKPRVERLVSMQKELVNQLLNEAKKALIEKPNDKDGGLALFRAHRGLPKYKPLIKYLSETGIRTTLQKTESIYLAENQKLMPEADKPLFFTIDERNNQIELTQKGIQVITASGEDESFFILPDIGGAIAKIEKDHNKTPEDRADLKQQLIDEYSAKAERIHTVNQLLKAYCLFEKDTEYVLIDKQVKIVDESTGRMMEGRRYSDGLHQAIEAKEGVTIEEATQTYATVTLQNYFRMYHKLAGMTGTAETEAGEFWDIYKLDVVVIPTNQPVTRKDQNDFIYKTVREKYNAVAEEIQALVAKERPVLVGTTSVEISELLSRLLNLRKIKHQVLNAKQHAKEAEVVAEAGKPGTVTIATNMAGRGTDIKLTPEAKKAGGLAIIGTERHESRRVDRQLRGRSGRQGDPGTSLFYVSLDDNLMRLFGGERIANLMDKMGLKEGEVIQHSMVTKSIERAQKKVEENNFASRKRLLEFDDVMNIQREQIYKRRRNALFGDRLQIDIYNMIWEVCKYLINTMQSPDNYNAFELEVINVLGFDPTSVSESDFKTKPAAELAKMLFKQALAAYQAKNQALAEMMFPNIEQQYISTGKSYTNVVIPFSDGKRQIYLETDFAKAVETKCVDVIRTMEKVATLALIDQEWKEHLRDMDDLKQSVQMAVHEQKDPLLVYKFESFEMFKVFVSKVNKDVVSFLMKAGIYSEDDNEMVIKEARSLPKKNEPKLTLAKADSIQDMIAEANQNEPAPVQKIAPMKAVKIADRNQKVNVKYANGTVMKDVKYKKVEDDINNNRCVLID